MLAVQVIRDCDFTVSPACPGASFVLYRALCHRVLHKQLATFSEANSTTTCLRLYQILSTIFIQSLRDPR